MHSRISFRLGVTFGLIIFFTVALSYIYEGRQLRELFVNRVRGELKRELKLNSQLLALKPENWGDLNSSDTWADQVGTALEVRVTIIDLKGNVIGDSSIETKRLAMVPNHLGRPEVRDALLKGFGEHTRFSETLRENMLYMAIPLGFPERYGVLRFAKPLNDIRALEDEVREGIEIGLFWTLLISLSAAALTAILLSRPLTRIADSADKFLHGARDEKIVERRNDEIGRLARVFNYMSDEINGMSQQEEWFRAVISSIREAILVTSAEGEVILVNPAASRLFTIDGAMMRSKPVKRIASPEMEALLQRIHASRSMQFKEEVTLRTLKGERILGISGVPLIKNGRFDGSVIVINDLTRLRALEKMRRDFVSSVSHELRTPLASIRGYAETLLEGAMDDPEHASNFLGIILQESEQLTALVNDVLDLSKIESGKIDYLFRPVDIREVVEHTAALLAPAVEKKRISMEHNISDSLPRVLADSNYLEIVMRNLMDNAIKYVDDEHGRIRIRAFCSNETMKIEVEDNGTGIPPQDLDRIFERFYRVDKARSRQLSGTGLGLSIVKHIVLAHNGRIEVRSRVNQGSVFTITLPLAREKKVT
jgi:two-component system phosphate regulon sensor histidine kinase PhoR